MERLSYVKNLNLAFYINNEKLTYLIMIPELKINSLTTQKQLSI